MADCDLVAFGRGIWNSKQRTEIQNRYEDGRPLGWTCAITLGKRGWAVGGAGIHKPEPVEVRKPKRAALKVQRQREGIKLDGKYGTRRDTTPSRAIENGVSGSAWEEWMQGSGGKGNLWEVHKGRWMGECIGMKRKALKRRGTILGKGKGKGKNRVRSVRVRCTRKGKGTGLDRRKHKDPGYNTHEGSEVRGVRISRQQCERKVEGANAMFFKAGKRREGKGKVPGLVGRVLGSTRAHTTRKDFKVADLGTGGACEHGSGGSASHNEEKEKKKGQCLVSSEYRALPGRTRPWETKIRDLGVVTESGVADHHAKCARGHVRSPRRGESLGLGCVPRKLGGCRRLREKGERGSRKRENITHVPKGKGSKGQEVKQVVGLTVSTKWSCKPIPSPSLRSSRLQAVAKGTRSIAFGERARNKRRGSRENAERNRLS
ncbi:hypothetical protein B0H11DRAFT_1941074 [Mycena galericulata]|nr:hypothetical protein B0H11DRAFT_1941074 [Mycena galericulata]